MDRPTYCEIQYWNAMTASWETGHSGLQLMNPAAYVQRLAKRGVLARAIDRDTGEMVGFRGEGSDLL